MPAPVTVIYDSCVLYPAPLRDLLMHLALTGLFRARWTERIHKEWISAVLARRPDLTRQQLERTRELMDAHVLDAVVTGYEELIPGLQLPDPDDRHVLAAAIHSGAQVIVTFNLADFPSAATMGHGIAAQHPDEFIVELIERSPTRVCGAVRRQRSMLKKPPKTVDEFLAILESQKLTRAVEKLRGLMDQL